jgi:hypothetical protein
MERIRHAERRPAAELARVGLRAGDAAVEVDPVAAVVRRLGLDLHLRRLRAQREGAGLSVDGVGPVAKLLPRLDAVVAPLERLERVVVGACGTVRRVVAGEAEEIREPLGTACGRPLHREAEQPLALARRHVEAK